MINSILQHAVTVRRPSLLKEALQLQLQMRGKAVGRSGVDTAHVDHLRHIDAAALRREHGIIARMELAERRVDFAAAYEIFLALAANPENDAVKLMRRFSRVEKAGC